MNEKQRKILFFITFLICFGILYTSSCRFRLPRDNPGSNINTETIASQQQEGIRRNTTIQDSINELGSLNEQSRQNNKKARNTIVKGKSAIDRAEGYIRANQQIIEDLLRAD